MIHESASIHPSAVIEGNVRIGAGTTVGHSLIFRVISKLVKTTRLCLML